MEIESKTQWLKEGDANTSNFHRMANGRFQVNDIDTILHENMEMNNQVDLNNIFADHFQQIFGTSMSHRADFIWQDLYSIQNWNFTVLEMPFTKDKIKMAVFSTNADGSPDPDGFSAFFFQEFRYIVKNEFFDMITEFYYGYIKELIMLMLFCYQRNRVLIV